MSVYNYPKPGLFNVGSYQTSGEPWLTGSTTLVPGAEDHHQFPRTAKSVTVINTDASNDDIRVHFNASSAGNVITGLHFVALNNLNESISFGVRCREIFISAPATNAGNASYTVVAELTNIDGLLMGTLTGSGLTD